MALPEDLAVELGGLRGGHGQVRLTADLAHEIVGGALVDVVLGAVLAACGREKG